MTNNVNNGQMVHGKKNMPFLIKYCKAPTVPRVRRLLLM